jgi:hypothetical protein
MNTNIKLPALYLALIAMLTLPVAANAWDHAPLTPCSTHDGAQSYGRSILGPMDDEGKAVPFTQTKHKMPIYIVETKNEINA